MRILLIDEEIDSAKSIGDFFTTHGYQTDVAGNLKDGYYYTGIRHYNLILMSLKLGQNDIYELLGEIKSKNSKTKIILVSHKFPDHANEIASFKAGADDYIYKPLDSTALLSRIEAHLKLSSTGIIEVEDLIINPDEERIIYQGREVEVKGKPFEVLTHLARHKDQIVSKEQLLDAIWEEPELVTPNVIEVAINQIRQRLDKPLGIHTIETVRRRGYRFCYPKPID